ncbi:MAG TPA: di-heme oxidoredictase family protein [Stellaceae bacterium]|nr:di-heme oxidoredictase family protein [Stellaceae bacterium]
MLCNLRLRRCAGATVTVVVAMAGLLAQAALAGGASPTGSTATPPHGGPRDPGVRGGAAGAGGSLPGLGTAERNLFAAARDRFAEVDSVSGTINDAPPGVINGFGLGPRFNLNSCSGCHAQPAIGGTSPPVNPEVAMAALDGARNTVPSFVTLNGPVREARFITNPDGSADGGVHNLYVITGRGDAAGCTLAQPNFAGALRQNNVIFRIPTPVFGAGLVENTPDTNLAGDAAALSSLRQANGVGGNFNHNGNDGTISRFGWKAQNKSLMMFAGEAYNVEQGVTNELFPNEREDAASCRFNPMPEDATSLADGGLSNSPASDYSSDVVNFAAFMRLSAPPAPAPVTASATRGQRAFVNVGCNLCHIAQHTTARSIYTGQDTRSYSPFSDFQLHDMGTRLADRVSQGQADGDQFRTAPLWGVGQRIFFLHDSRTRDLLSAIEDHASNGSEANTVIGNFNALPSSAQQDILNFLRSL